MAKGKGGFLSPEYENLRENFLIFDALQLIRVLKSIAVCRNKLPLCISFQLPEIVFRRDDTLLEYRNALSLLSHSEKKSKFFKETNFFHIF